MMKESLIKFCLEDILTQARKKRKEKITARKNMFHFMQCVVYPSCASTFLLYHKIKNILFFDFHPI